MAVITAAHGHRSHQKEQMRCRPWALYNGVGLCMAQLTCHQPVQIFQDVGQSPLFPCLIKYQPVYCATAGQRPATKAGYIVQIPIPYRLNLMEYLMHNAIQDDKKEYR